MPFDFDELFLLFFLVAMALLLECAPTLHENSGALQMNAE